MKFNGILVVVELVISIWARVSPKTSSIHNVDKNRIPVPIILSIKPLIAKSFILKNPVENTIVFGGVETGLKLRKKYHK